MSNNILTDMVNPETGETLRVPLVNWQTYRSRGWTFIEGNATRAQTPPPQPVDPDNPPAPDVQAFDDAGPVVDATAAPASPSGGAPRRTKPRTD